MTHDVFLFDDFGQNLHCYPHGAVFWYESSLFFYIIDADKIYRQTG